MRRRLFIVREAYLGGAMIPRVWKRIAQSMMFVATKILYLQLAIVASYHKIRGTLISLQELIYG